MITTAITEGFRRGLAEGIHQIGDTYKLALIRKGSKGTYDKQTCCYGELLANGDEVMDTARSGRPDLGYKPGGIVLSSYVNSAGDLCFREASWKLASISAEGGMIYNASKRNAAFMVFKFGETVTSINGAFSVPANFFIPAQAWAWQREQQQKVS